MRWFLLVLVTASCTAPAEDELPAATECLRCHALDRAHARDHETRPTTCASCHSETAWEPSVLRHDWALTGAHEEAACFDCHRPDPAREPRFEGTDGACVACHADDEAGTFEAHHAFGTDCASCHTTTAFRPATRHPEPPPPPPALDAGMPDAGHDAGHDAGTRRRRTRGTGGTTTTDPPPDPTPDPPPDTTTHATWRR